MATRMLPGFPLVNVTNAVGVLPVDHGGTGATTAAGARANLGISTSGPATATAGETLVAGNVIYLSAAGGGTAGHAYKASTSVSGFSMVGVVTTGGATGATIEYVLSGPSVSVLMVATPGATDNGKEVYLSGTSGQATIVAPTTGALVRMGFLVGGNGADPTPAIQFIPQPIAIL